MTRSLFLAALVGAAAANEADPTPIDVFHAELGGSSSAFSEDDVCEGTQCAQDTIDVLSFRFDRESMSDSRYIGSWNGDKPSGKGFEESAVGTYQGSFSNGLRNGMGEYLWAAERGPAATYKGFWSDGEMNGLGALSFSNGDRFFGVWKMGEKAGEGFYLENNELDVTVQHTDGAVKVKAAICVYEDGSSYAGQIWAPFKVNGEVSAVRQVAEVADPVDTVDGVCHWVPGADGTQFEFVKPHGRGVFQYTNGDRYAGRWEHGRPHGNGMLVSADGTVEYGVWNKGVMMTNLGIE